MLPRILLPLLLAAPAAAQLPFADPAVTGCVTVLSATGSFEVQGVPVTLTPQTTYYRQVGKEKTEAAQLDPPYFGQTMQVWGRFDKKTKALNATYVLQFPPALNVVRGGGMIDLMPAAQGADHVFRADGYTLHLTPETVLHFNPPLTSLDDLKTNVWIEYRGMQQLDGSVTVNGAEVWPNTVLKSETKLRAKQEFDPAAVSESDKQSGASKFFLGNDGRKLPAHHDEALQARVTRIGQSLIPAYQKALREDDPTRINFRFQVVESDYFRDAVTFANGIILVPWPAVSRLQNDSQIATVLADNIACALEKQEVVHKPTLHMLTALDVAGGAAGAFVPGAGLATALATGGSRAHIHTQELRQSGRVSLALMHDAGYDLHEAPVAWRLLDPKRAEPLEQTEIGDRAAYSYFMVGNVWR